MNKLDTSFLGGDPDDLDSVEFMQSALAEGIRGAASAWQWAGSDPVVIAGLTASIVGLNTVFTDGFVVINSEFYFVPGQTFVTASIVSSIGVNFTPTFDTGGDEEFESLAINSTWIVRRGILQLGTSGSNVIDIADFISKKSALANMGACINLETAWYEVGVGGAPAFAAGWSAITSGGYVGNKVRYRLDKNGQLELGGLVANAASDASGDNIIFVLPVNFRPASMRAFSMLGINVATGGTVILIAGYIFPNGEVHIATNGSVAINIIASFDSVKLPLL